MKKLLTTFLAGLLLAFAGLLISSPALAQAASAPAAAAASAAVEAASAPAAAAAPASAAAPAAAPAPVPNKGDTAFMTIATVLVILMTIPGLALFYGGLVRSNHILSVLMQVFCVFCLISVLWVVYGYSLAFTASNPYIGGLSKMFLG
ncbi:MAG: ammonia channel protein, partial [Betaproteobacteria bacterium]